MKEVERKSQSGQSKAEEAAIGTTAAYAVDLMDIRKEIGKPYLCAFFDHGEIEISSCVICIDSLGGGWYTVFGNRIILPFTRAVQAAATGLR